MLRSVRIFVCWTTRKLNRCVLFLVNFMTFGSNLLIIIILNATWYKYKFHFFLAENIEPEQKMLEPFSIPTTDGKWVFEIQLIYFRK